MPENTLPETEAPAAAAFHRQAQCPRFRRARHGRPSERSQCRRPPIPAARGDHRGDHDQMTAPSAFRIPASDLLRRLGAQRTVALRAPVPALGAGAAAVADGTEVALDIVLERVPEGIVARGTIRAPWRADCSRCLAPAAGDVVVHVDELFEREPVVGETYLLEPDAVDLEPLVRDAVVLELPPAPLCRPGCAGLCPICGIDRNERDCDCTVELSDPRWAALRSLEL